MNNSDPYLNLENLISLLPTFYRKEPAFSDCVKLVKDHDANAIESLIALTQVKGHYFSDDFWKELSKCAAVLNSPSHISYCNQQLEKNAKELGSHKSPLGWTMVKLGPSKYMAHIAQSLRDKWNEERHHKHNVPELMQKNGFYFIREGKAGTIYRVKDGQLVEMDVEMCSGEYNIIISFDSVAHYALPEAVGLSESEKDQLKIELIEWLSEKEIKARFG